MNINEVTFDNFLSLSIDEQNQIFNDFDLLKLLVKKNISEHRYLHSLSVANTCKELALCHDVDSNKAYLAGLLHDCCKFKDESILLEYLNKYDKDKINGCIGAYHSWVAPYYLKEKLNFSDKEILNAIYNHTILNSEDKLSLILYIADKREPLRGINDALLEKAKVNLIGVYKELVKDVEEFVKSKNERFIKNSI